MSKRRIIRNMLVEKLILKIYPFFQEMATVFTLMCHANSIVNRWIQSQVIKP